MTVEKQNNQICVPSFHVFCVWRVVSFTSKAWFSWASSLCTWARGSAKKVLPCSPWNWWSENRPRNNSRSGMSENLQNYNYFCSFPLEAYFSCWKLKGLSGDQVSLKRHAEQSRHSVTTVVEIVRFSAWAMSKRPFCDRGLTFPVPGFFFLWDPDKSEIPRIKSLGF